MWTKTKPSEPGDIRQYHASYLWSVPNGVAYSYILFTSEGISPERFKKLVDDIKEREGVENITILSINDLGPVQPPIEEE